MARLRGKIAVVTGASRGAGRGIAVVLGGEGATVYVTGRSMRGGPNTDGRPETVEGAAEAVTARGGHGIAVRCDHTVDEQVQALFERVRKEQGPSIFWSTTPGAAMKARGFAQRCSGTHRCAFGTQCSSPACARTWWQVTSPFQ